MAKDKKKHSKKDKLSKDILDVATVSVKKFRKVTREISKLSMGQKVVGGVALLAVGLTYLAKSEAGGDKKSAAPPRPTPMLLTEAGVTTASDDDDTVATAPTTTSRKSRKSSKSS
jgi:hypothetical protein